MCTLSPYRKALIECCDPEPTGRAVAQATTAKSPVTARRPRRADHRHDKRFHALTAVSMPSASSPAASDSTRLAVSRQVTETHSP